jgi:hypothetical protein
MRRAGLMSLERENDIFCSSIIFAKVSSDSKDERLL